MYTAEYTPNHPLVTAAEQAFRAGRVTDAFRLCKQLVREATADRDDFLLVYVLSNLSLLECVHGEPGEAFRNVFEAQRLAARLKVASISRKIEMRYVDLLRRFGSLRETSARINAILRSGQHTPLEPFDEAILLTTLGLVYLDLRQFTYAEASFQQGLLLCRAKGVDVQIPHMSLGLLMSSTGPAWCQAQRDAIGEDAEPWSGRASHQDAERHAIATLATANHATFERLVGFERAKWLSIGGNHEAARTEAAAYMAWAGRINDRLSLERGRADVALMHLLAGDEERMIGSLEAQNGHLPGDRAAIARRDFFLCRAAAHERVGLFREALAAYKMSTSMRQALALQAMAPFAAPGFPSKPTSPGVDQGLMVGHSRACRLAVEFIHSQLAENLSVTSIAASIPISVRHLQLLFRAELNATPLEIVRNARLDHARKLLSGRDASSLTVRDVAQQVGMRRAGTFISEYRKRFAELPSETLRRAAR